MIALKDYRRKKGLTQKQIAKVLGTTVEKLVDSDG